MKQLKQCSPLRVQPSNTTSLEKSSLSYTAAAAVIDGESSDYAVASVSKPYSTMSSSSSSFPDKKINVVLYGIEECQSGTLKSARLESDLTSVASVLSTIDASIQPHSIKDCYRLGKFTSDRRKPRPILIKFIKIADVTSILAKKSNLAHPYFLKQDLTREQRKNEFEMLQERWNLIHSGFSHKD